MEQCESHIEPRGCAGIQFSRLEEMFIEFIISFSTQDAKSRQINKKVGSFFAVSEQMNYLK